MTWPMGISTCAYMIQKLRMAFTLLNGFLKKFKTPIFYDTWKFKFLCPQKNVIGTAILICLYIVYGCFQTQWIGVTDRKTYKNWYIKKKNWYIYSLTRHRKSLLFSALAYIHKDGIARWHIFIFCCLID